MGRELHQLLRTIGGGLRCDDRGIEGRLTCFKANYHPAQPISLAYVRELAIDDERVGGAWTNSAIQAGGGKTLLRQVCRRLNTYVVRGLTSKFDSLIGLILARHLSIGSLEEALVEGDLQGLTANGYTTI